MLRLCRTLREREFSRETKTDISLALRVRLDLSQRFTRMLGMIRSQLYSSGSKFELQMQEAILAVRSQILSR